MPTMGQTRSRPILNHATTSTFSNFNDFGVESDRLHGQYSVAGLSIEMEMDDGGLLQRQMRSVAVGTKALLDVKYKSLRDDVILIASSKVGSRARISRSDHPRSQDFGLWKMSKKLIDDSLSIRTLKRINFLVYPSGSFAFY
jgi:hypothetical protein